MHKSHFFMYKIKVKYSGARTGMVVIKLRQWYATDSKICLNVFNCI